MEKIEGYVDHIIYRNQENGYTVMVLTSEDTEITCVGTFSYIGEGERLEAEGTYIAHPTYGEQFRVETYAIRPPEDEESVERYLGSGAIKGVGTALAARIVRRFRADTFRIIEEEPERLAEIKGISERKAREIAQQIYEKRDMRKAMLFLQQFGVSTALAVKIFEKYGQRMYEVIEQNPYRLADDISGIGFRIADEIAKRAGVSFDSEYRVKCGISYVLQQAASEGHVFLPKELLLGRTTELLGVPIDDLDPFLVDMAIQKKIVIRKDGDRDCVYSASAYYMEMSTARMLVDLNITGEIDAAVIEKKIASIEQETGTVLDGMQKKAVIEAVRCGLLVITGGPGTGKTTTINTLISYFESEGLQILLAAPTGRAAKRMTEATGFEAKTVHRLLEISGVQEDGGSTEGFGRNAQNPLDADVIIIDEMSMVDIYLMHALLDAVTIGTRLIMVGDMNQLPSVGPGSILKDIIESNEIPVVQLTRIFRQAKESDIVVNAHKINRGEPVVLDNKSMDFFFLKRDDTNMIISNIITLIQKKLPKFVNAKEADIQVLTPMRKGLLGVERINKILQEYLNPPKPGKQEKEYGDHLFREGDKVMQIKNNYQLEWEISTRYGMTIDKGIGVFNGDMGIIRKINTYEETVTVEYDEKKLVKYPYNLLDELELAYAITIHKAQGSEYPAVIIPLLQGPRQLYYRNLLYTAVTRARKCVTVIGSESVFQEMIHNTNQQNRNTSLAERIRELNES